MSAYLTDRLGKRLTQSLLAGALVVALLVLLASNGSSRARLASAVSDSLMSSSFEDRDRKPHLAVVMPFTSFDVKKVQDNLRGWTTTPPCARPPASPRPVFYLYSNKALEEGVASELQGSFDALPSGVKRCFEDVRFTQAMISAELDHYTPDARDPDWVAGPNEQFYQLMNGSHTAEGTTHVFMMEPDTRPVISGWLSQLVKVVEESEPFWIRGSAFRAACATSKTVFGKASSNGDCHQLGPDIAEHINGNALYNIGDPNFLAFLQEVRESKFTKWPFDLAWLLYSRLPDKEPLRRSLLSKIAYTDMMQNLGAASFDLKEFKTENPRTYFIHSDSDGT
ncbi:hypothetical protein BCR35DRAFT_331682 [Leucosporidium creatinivorum]|uniref:Nucleotide-diphospho-sugar transferase n=1 Tax=Leucosporidium creatinivorum TaxID=106004 RepID=A0A1Y2FBJ3_9BASI|nr:hypothetical protein BCR35DRAFT_331682 [Leucosporidium creatinivorum]